MKRILMALMVASVFCSLVLAQQKTTILKDSIGKAKVTVTKTEPGKKGGSVTVSSADNDSVFVAEFSDTPNDSTYVSDGSDTADTYKDEFDLLNEFGNSGAGAATIILVAVILIITFSFPLFVVFIAFYFRYKSRKARYKLVEQALAAGQPIPEGVFKETMNLDTRTKGIKNVCLGTGLFIFLWALTSSFAMGCIGLLIMFTGVGQYLVAPKQKPTDEQR